MVFRGGGRTSVVKEQGNAKAIDADMQPVEKSAKKPKGKDLKQEYYEGSMDVVCMVDDSHFISGGDSG